MVVDELLKAKPLPKGLGVCFTLGEDFSCALSHAEGTICSAFSLAELKSVKVRTSLAEWLNGVYNAGYQ